MVSWTATTVIFSWYSPFLNVFFTAEEVSLQVYNNRITLTTIENVEAQLRINEWHKNFSIITLHPSYTTLLYQLYDFHGTDCEFLGAHLETYKRGKYIDEDTYFLPPKDPEVSPESQHVCFLPLNLIFTAHTVFALLLVLSS